MNKMDDGDQQFGQMTLKELKDELKRRGASQSGRKKDLVEQ